MPKKRGFFDERDAIDILREAFWGKPKRTRKPRVQLASIFSSLISPAAKESNLELIAKSNQAQITELQSLRERRGLSPEEERELHARTAAHVSQYDMAEIEKVLETSRQIGTEIPHGYKDAAAIIKLEIEKLKGGNIPAPEPQVAIPKPAIPTPEPVPEPPPVPVILEAPPVPVDKPLEPEIESPILPTPDSAPHVEIIPETPPEPISMSAEPPPVPSVPKLAEKVPDASNQGVRASDLPSIESLEEQMKAAEKQVMSEVLAPPAPPIPPIPPQASDTASEAPKPMPDPLPPPKISLAPPLPKRETTTRPSLKVEKLKKALEIKQKGVTLPKPPPIPKLPPASKIKPLDTLEPTPLTPEETDDLLNGHYPEAIVSPEELAQVLEKKKPPAASKKPAPQKKSGNFQVTAKKGDALWNLIEDRLGSSDAMGKDFANKFNALPSGKRIHIIDAVENFIRKSKDLFHITDPDLIHPGDTIDLAPILDDEKSMLELVANAQDTENALDATIAQMNTEIIDKSRANGDKTLVELEIDKVLFGPMLPVAEKIPPEENSSETSQPAAVLPGTEKKKAEIMLCPGENRWRKFLGFSAEHYNSIRNIKVKQLLDLIPSREKAEISWNSAVRQELLDVPRRKFDSMVRLSEFIRGYSSGNGKGIREMTIRQFLEGISKDRKN